MARNAYSGILAGCWMHNSIKRRSLITGNVSTDESRKEIRNRPGAPRPPANATIFCFHPFRLGGKRFPPLFRALICSACPTVVGAGLAPPVPQLAANYTTLL